MDCQNGPVQEAASFSVLTQCSPCHHLAPFLREDDEGVRQPSNAVCVLKHGWWTARMTQCRKQPPSLCWHSVLLVTILCWK
jgi:hypothetical protein